MTATGDVVARLPGDPAAADMTRRLQGVIDKWALVGRLKTAAERRSQALAVTPDDRSHRQGETVSLAISGNEGAISP